MPTFEIPDGPTTVELQGTGDEKNPGPATGSVVFNVTNKSTETTGGSLSVQVAGSTQKDWFRIEGDQVRSFGPGETQTAKINISVPKDIAPGDYPFRLRAAAENDPDNDAAEGPVSVAKKKEAAVAVRKSKWWLWLIIALLVLAAIGAGVYFAFLRDGEPEPAPTPTAETKVPKFIDQNVDSIAANAGGYQIVKNETANTNRQPRIVYDQDPKPDTPLAAGQKVIVSYEPGVVVPDLPGNATFVSAPNILRGAGLQPGAFLCDRSLSGTSGAPVGRVTKFNPPSGTRVAANSQVGMFAVQSTQCMGRLIDRHRLEVIAQRARIMQER